MTIGMPNINITFSKLAATIVSRSTRGVVGLIIKDDTDDTFNVAEYKTVLDIETAKYTVTNLQYIKDVFTGGTAAKVVVIRVDTDSVTVVADAIAAVSNIKLNWIGLAEGTTSENADLVSYVKTQETAKKSLKAVVFNPTVAPDCQHIVNFTNSELTYTDGTTITGDKFVARLLGTFAGLALTRSATYMSFSDVASVVEPADRDTAIDAGQLILINDEGTCRIARAVNSLTTLSTSVTEDFKKILITESQDMIRDDLFTLFKDSYVGKYRNTYDHQVLLLSAINGYFSTLETEGVLDDSYDNLAYVDTEAQRALLIAVGKDASDWDDVKVNNTPVGSKVILAANIMIPDAIEDFVFSITME